MRRIVSGLAALLAAACATATLPERLLSGATSPAAMDFRALDETALGAVMTELSAAQTLPACDGRRLHAEAAFAWVNVALRAPDAESYRRDTEALRARLAEFDAHADALARGEAPAAPRGDINAATLQARALSGATDPIVRELFSRAAREQLARVASFDPAWVEGLPPSAAQHWPMIMTGVISTDDCANTAWLQEQLAQRTWFDIPTYGAPADGAARLIVQHADLNPAFQEQMLTRLEALPPGHTDASAVAYLGDRVAVAQGRPQRYGTQGACAAEGGWRPHAVEDEANLDARRAAVGLMPMAEYIPIFVQLGMCPAPAAE